MNNWNEKRVIAEKMNVITMKYDPIYATDLEQIKDQAENKIKRHMNAQIARTIVELTEKVEELQKLVKELQERK